MYWHRVLAAGVFLASTAAEAQTATATPPLLTYTFSVYPTQLSNESGVLSSTFTLTGSFTGIDVNGDGNISLFELQSLAAYNYVWGRGSPSVESTPKEFEYSPTTGLHALVQGAASGRIFFQFDPNSGYFRYSSPGGSNSISWLPTTVVTVTSPVPEPASYGLALAGLFGIGATVRRRTLPRR